MNYLSARLREPSTWAAVAALIPAVAQVATGTASPEMVGGIAAAVAAVLMREKGGNGV